MTNKIEDLIGYLYLVREKVRKVDTRPLWEYYLPSIKTNEQTICDFEKRNELSLPSEYRDFLKAANGWKCIVQDKDLFSLEELSFDKNSNAIMFRDNALPNMKVTCRPEMLLPIGAARYSYDVYLLNVDIDSEDYGCVIWAAGEEIERHPCFNEFFLSLIEYNKQEYEVLSGQSFVL